MKSHPHTHSAAFSLFELAVVLAILGLLVGGIVAGQSLIRSSELQSVATEYNRYLTATTRFIDKYAALPGDFSKATHFWSYQGGTGCTNNTGAATVGTGVCDGNADGNVGASWVANQSAEMQQFWRQLAAGGFIDGKYSGLVGPAGGRDSVFTGSSINTPPSRLKNAGWSVYALGSYPGDASTYNYEYGNTIFLGAYDSASVTDTGALKPEEAWNIDKKLDDGNPGSGQVMTRNSGYSWGDSRGCTLATSYNDYTSGYNLSATGYVCPLLFVRQF